MTRLVGVFLAALVLAVAAGASPSAGPGPYLGIRGDPDRFQRQTGQSSVVLHAFLGWGQGQTWGSRFSVLFEGLQPIPMIHIGTGGPGGRGTAITPAQIAAGRGDDYLVALNQAIAAWGRQIYVRPLAEMNNAVNRYAGYTRTGRLRPPNAPPVYQKAFARIFLILHGGAAVNAELQKLGLPAVASELAANPRSRLVVIWNPLGASIPKVPGNHWSRYYPGNKFVDLVGNDMYDSTFSFSARDNEELFRFARSHGKRYSFPEWGETVDDPAFIRYICDFIRKHRANIELSAYYESKPGSAFDLEPRGKSRAVYRRCLSPLGVPAPG